MTRAQLPPNPIAALQGNPTGMGAGPGRGYATPEAAAQAAQYRDVLLHGIGAAGPQSATPHPLLAPLAASATQTAVPMAPMQQTNLSMYNQFDPNEGVPDAYSFSGGAGLPPTGFMGAGSWYNLGVI